MSDELDEIRKRRLKELQEATADGQDEELRRQQEEAQKAYEQRKQAILRAVLSDKAKQRLSNLKLVKPEMTENIENQLVQLAQAGRIPGGRLSEKQLLKLLKRIQGKKRDSSITFKRV